MGISLETATVTCQMTYNNSVNASIDITEFDNVEHVYSVNIIQSTTIKLGQSQSYGAYFYDNGTDINSKSAVRFSAETVAIHIGEECGTAIIKARRMYGSARRIYKRGKMRVVQKRLMKKR